MALNSVDNTRLARAAWMVPLAGLVLAVYVVYLIGLVVYRLYFSPLAKFPGPKLATITRWYEAYYEIVLSGQYSFKIDKLHDIYGIILFCSRVTSLSER
jgi:hypothetical protein